jgi:HAD superfamily hydrolase (TIGR01509 family)
VHTALPWSSIDTVLLDMDGTLLDLHFDNYFWLEHLPKRYSEVHQVDRSRAAEHISAKIKSLEGTLEWYCLDHWSDLMNLDIPLLKLELRDKIQKRPFVDEFLQHLRMLNKRVVLITNAHPKGLKIKLEVTKIDQWLDIIISSHDFGSPKEDQKFWHQLQDKESFNPERSLFIDDTPRILRSAREYGIAHLLCITSPDSQRETKNPEEFPGVEHFNELLPLST